MAISEQDELIRKRRKQQAVNRTLRNYNERMPTEPRVSESAYMPNVPGSEPYQDIYNRRRQQVIDATVNKQLTQERLRKEKEAKLYKNIYKNKQVFDDYKDKLYNGVINMNKRIAYEPVRRKKQAYLRGLMAEEQRLQGIRDDRFKFNDEVLDAYESKKGVIPRWKAGWTEINRQVQDATVQGVKSAYRASHDFLWGPPEVQKQTVNRNGSRKPVQAQPVQAQPVQAQPVQAQPVNRSVTPEPRQQKSNVPPGLENFHPFVRDAETYYNAVKRQGTKQGYVPRKTQSQIDREGYRNPDGSDIAYNPPENATQAEINAEQQRVNTELDDRIRYENGELYVDINGNYVPIPTGNENEIIRQKPVDRGLLSTRSKPIRATQEQRDNLARMTARQGKTKEAIQRLDDRDFAIQRQDELGVIRRGENAKDRARDIAVANATTSGNTAKPYDPNVSVDDEGNITRGPRSVVENAQRIQAVNAYTDTLEGYDRKKNKWGMNKIGDKNKIKKANTAFIKAFPNIPPEYAYHNGGPLDQNGGYKGVTAGEIQKYLARGVPMDAIIAKIDKR